MLVSVRPKFWPTLACISTAAAIVSSSVAIYSVSRLETVLAARSDQQLRLLSDRMNDAIVAASATAAAGDVHLDKRIDAMRAKFDPLPGQVDLAVQAMQKQVTAAIAKMKAAAPPTPPAPTASHDDAPTVKRKKAG